MQKRSSDVGGEGIRGPKRDQTHSGSWILADTGLEAILPAFSAISEGLAGCFPVSLNIERRLMRGGNLMWEGMP